MSKETQAQYVKRVQAENLALRSQVKTKDAAVKAWQEWERTAVFERTQRAAVEAKLRDAEAELKVFKTWSTPLEVPVPISLILHVLRNPYGWSDENVRTVSREAAKLLELWRPVEYLKREAL